MEVLVKRDSKEMKAAKGKGQNGQMDVMNEVVPFITTISESARV